MTTVLTYMMLLLTITLTTIMVSIESARYMVCVMSEFCTFWFNNQQIFEYPEFVNKGFNIFSSILNSEHLSGFLVYLTTISYQESAYAILFWFKDITVVTIPILALLVYFYYELINGLDREDWETRYMAYYILIAIMLLVRGCMVITGKLGQYIITKLMITVTFVFIDIPSGFINTLYDIPQFIVELITFSDKGVDHLMVVSTILMSAYILWVVWQINKVSLLSIMTRMSPNNLSEFLWLLLKVFILILGLSLLPDVCTYLSELSDCLFVPLFNTGEDFLFQGGYNMVNNELLHNASSLITSSSLTGPSIIKVVQTAHNASGTYNMSFFSSVSPLSTLSSSSGEPTRLGPLSPLGNQLIDNMMINQHKQFGHVLALDNPTRGALESARMLSSMVYQLEHSTFVDDHKLLEYLVQVSNNPVTYGCHFDGNSPTLKPNLSYSVPLGRGHSFVNSAGVYALTIDIDGVDHNYIGSALSLLKRLREHLSSLDGHKESTNMHHIINGNGGVGKLLWSPLITMPNLVKDWYVSNPLASISQGANNTLKGFAQHQVRLMETAMISQYSPQLNGGPVVHFNFSVSPDDFNVGLDATNQYRAICANTGNVLAESNSFQRLSTMLGKTNTTISTYMNWKNPMNVEIAGEPQLIYLREEGKPIITEPWGTMLNPKQMYPLLTIGEKSVYDLEVGKLYAITHDWNIHGTYESQAELWTALYPSGIAQPKGNTNVQTIGALTNVARLNKTEVGEFYYACNPLYPMGFSSGKPFFAINILSGVAMLYMAKSTCPYLGKTAVHRALRTGCILNDTYRCIYKADLVKSIPRSMKEDTLTLTTQEVDSLTSIKGRK